MRALALAAILVAVPSIACAAGPYDGSVPMKCAIEVVFACQEAASCVRGTAQTVSLPPVITVDVTKRLISGDAAGRTAGIEAVGHGAGQLMIYGQDVETLGKAWGLTVTEQTGAMWGAVLSRVGGILIFGACAAP